jgi:hypothetical protein
MGIGDLVGADQRGRDLAEEAIWLARVLLQLLAGRSRDPRLVGPQAALRSAAPGTQGA